MQTEENKNCTSAFWGICCEGGKKYSQVVKQKFHITMAALDPLVEPTSKVVSLMVDRGGCEYLLCSLKPSSVIQVNLNLYFDKGEKVTFSLRGQGKVHLSGYHIYDISEKTDIIEASKNISPMKKQAPTIKDNKPKQNAVTVKISDDSSGEDMKKSVSPKKSPNPQHKNSPASKKMEESEDDADDDDMSGLDDSLDEDDSDEDTDAKKDAKKLESYKRLWSSQIDEEDDESDEDSDDSDSDEKDKKQTSGNKTVQLKKKVKIETPSQNLKKSESVTGNKMASPKNALKLSDDLLNSSVGRTPMPQKKTPMKPNQANALTPKKVTFSGSDDSDSDEDVVMSPSKKQPTESNSVQTSEKKKKKKKKKKSLVGLNTSNVSEGIIKEEKTALPSASYNKKLPNGLEFEDIRVGNGPIAAKGKTVHVYYTGMLKNNKVFDSCKPGERRPFSFKLGSGEVIKGWDLAIEGMKVGGKRRMKIPALLGYKNKATGPIPPNSTLYFSVELKAVN